MTDKEAYRLIGERTEELAKDSKIQAKMLEMIHNGETKEEVEKKIYMMAIGTLIGIN